LCMIIGNFAPLTRRWRLTFRQTAVVFGDPRLDFASTQPIKDTKNH
jgi:hypothetical protein